MKKLIAILSTCLIVLGVCAACGNTAETETTVTEIASEESIASTIPEFPYMTINNEPFCVTVKEGFDNAGVTTYICDTTANYSFTCDDDDVSWDVYVLDAPFNEAARYLSQAEKPVLSGNGEADIKEGQYVYLACSCNAFTDDEADDAILSINYAEETANETTAAPEFSYMIINNEPFCVTVKDGFDNAGVTTYICDATAKYSFLCDDDDVSWDVYVLDAAFDDAARFLPQAETPVLSGNGVADIKEGQYIYLVCSCNAFTADEADDEVLSISYADGTLSGNYADSVSQRATAVVVEQETEDDDEIWVQISWSSSAEEATVWTMECKKTADGKLSYDDCEKVNVTTNANGESTTKEVYEDGKGYFTIQNSKLLWNGASEKDCADCVFELAK